MKKHTLSEDILICLTAAFVSSVWQYEMYFGETVNLLMSYGSLLLTAVIWTVTAFCEGRIKRIGFAVFTLLFYILPQIPVIYADNFSPNEFADALARLCRLFTRSAVIGNGSIIYPIAASSLFLLAFIAGELTAGKLHEKIIAAIPEGLPATGELTAGKLHEKIPSESNAHNDQHRSSVHKQE